MSEKPFEGVKITAQIQAITPNGVAIRKVEIEIPFTDEPAYGLFKVSAWIVQQSKECVLQAIEWGGLPPPSFDDDDLGKESNDRPQG